MSLRPTLALAVLLAACGTPGGGGGVGGNFGGFLVVDADGAGSGDAAAGDQVGDPGLVADAAPGDGGVDDSATGPDATAGEGVSGDATVETGLFDTKPAGCKVSADCDDKDACTTDGCNPASGACSHTKIAGCTAGKAAEPCDDSNACPSGVCDPEAHACVGCLESSDCGGGKLCLGKQCQPAPACKSDVDCKASKQVCSKDNGVCVDCNLSGDCGSGLACVGFKCVAAPSCGTSKDCAKVCDLGTSTCVDCLGADDCQPGEYCTATKQCKPDLCTSHACGTGGSFFACKADGSAYEAGLDCSDGNPCTDHACNAATGCTQTPNTKVCDDKDACTKGDLCKDGDCAGKPLDCDDDNPCTTDACNAKTGCVQVNNTAACDDGTACTTFDACKNGACAGSTAFCEDNNPCTTNGCDPQVGCTYDDNTAPCNDNSSCTSNDVCTNGACKGTAQVCDDKNDCTIDTCETVGGCKYKPGFGACDDGNACTVNDACNQVTGACQAGAAKVCSDANLCTNDACSAGQCVFTNNFASCTDNDLCTVGDGCAGGVCKAGGTAQVCNDGQPCTDDSCDPAKGCVKTANTAPCNDNNQCTENDACKNLACAGGTPKACSDGDGCTLDTCDTVKGCVSTADKAKCDDKNVCTTDSCSSPGGQCVHTAVAGCCATAAACDDKDSCTLDACAANACVHKSSCCKSADECDDGNACTKDACGAGICSSSQLPGSPTPDVAGDWETGSDGFTSGAAVIGFTWGHKVGKGAKVGQGAFVLSLGAADTFAGIKQTVSVTSVGPKVTLPIGKAYSLELWAKVDVTGGLSNSSSLTVLADLGNGKVVQLGSPKYNSIKDWQQFTLDASPLAGQTFNLQFRGLIYGYSTIAASGTGIFVDGLKLVAGCTAKACTAPSGCPTPITGFTGSCTAAGTCTYAPTGCKTATDCNDDNACTTDFCSSSGTCSYSAIASCCVGDKMCDDKNVCTWDSCGANNKCTFAAIAECCTANAQCDDKDTCTVDSCGANGKCAFSNTCCKADSECADGETKCTTDTCKNGACVHTPTGVAGCCSPGVFTEAFDGPGLTGWTFSNSSGIAKGWQQWKSATLTKSAPGVLYYGDPIAKNFNFVSGAANYGTALSPMIAVPATATDPTLKLWVYLATEGGMSYDKLTIYAVTGGTGKTKLWDKASVATSTWLEPALNLAAYKGKDIQLLFDFHTGDGIGNSGLGVLIDDLRLLQTCP